MVVVLLAIAPLTLQEFRPHPWSPLLERHRHAAVLAGALDLEHRVFDVLELAGQLPLYPRRRLTLHAELQSLEAGLEVHVAALHGLANEELHRDVCRRLPPLVAVTAAHFIGPQAFGHARQDQLRRDPSEGGRLDIRPPVQGPDNLHGCLQLLLAGDVHLVDDDNVGPLHLLREQLADVLEASLVFLVVLVPAHHLIPLLCLPRVQPIPAEATGVNHSDYLLHLGAQCYRHGALEADGPVPPHRFRLADAAELHDDVLEGQVLRAHHDVLYRGEEVVG
mmetsp:Transcript_95055/g.245567  ORF Transcript_95055/g.245567 Transcript_95055/m.245567 type:complete len:278 (-) Transcript_95055:286-1119(-)